MRLVLGTLTAVLVLGAASGACAQTFLSPGALKDGTRGYFGPGEPMTVPTMRAGRSVAPSAIKLACDRGDVVLCYPGSFAAIADVAGQ
jgi:hypothetical protein